MSIRILLIARDSEIRQAYAQAISDLGVEVISIPSLRGLDGDVTDLFYHGVAIDMRTKIHALKQDKEFIYTTLRKFPAAHLSLEKETQRIRVYYPGQSSGATLKNFVNEECRCFTPHRLAHHIRRQIHFNVILSRKKDLQAAHSERTVTVDVSEGGCFVFSVRDWAPGQTAWLTIMELADATPIGTHVRRCIQWGKGMRVPGVGLEFVEIGDRQAKEISDHLWG